MPRRSQTADPQSLRNELISVLQQLDLESSSADLRIQVQHLVAVGRALRDLGCSLVDRSGDAGSAKKRILAYLRRNAGQVVTSEELMVVGGISEYARRIRELRVEDGWDIISGVTARSLNTDAEEQGETAGRLPEMRVDDYLLRDAKPDISAAERWAIANEIRNTKAGVKEKLLTYFRRNVGQVVTGEELSYLAKDRSEWPRRIRELRTEEGWPIVTMQTGAPELPIGTYMLQLDRQAPPHDRTISDQVRRTVLKRDEYSCRNVLSDGRTCGWKTDDWQRADPRVLELHHMEHHAKGGSNEAANLITLCNVCHVDVHRRERRGD